MTMPVLSPPQRAEAPARSLRLLSLKPAAAADARATRRISSQLLLNGERELLIQHQGSEYHLRLTRNDKLILTK